MAMLASDESAAVREAIPRVALHDSDAAWVTDRALGLLGDWDSHVRGVAATALWHVARIHRAIDGKRVIPALRGLLNDPATADRTEDAPDDIAVFARTSVP
ncbi:hypothetical protein U3653_06400 [Nocardia sp. CDC186]|uniref:HEAT repeat domain-containing protein n=1 Tax=Nocardia implantans TaxID=3108168 RepID=A0ABU6AQ95_9NOCA|nr:MULTISPECIES: hypothetical protein [unclassified Nocardia]MBF6189986.1 hypothetical protein [Nocardia beijingensis]MEA3526781.1 hypothetical protein [Nocardia sp. CDC192]MEB3509642.1 hypothetical protein [Nocardia sp. CDC186]